MRTSLSVRLRFMRSLPVPVAGLLLGLALGGAGCATTRPWEREQLARPAMEPDGDGDREEVRRHVLGTREGAAGSFGGGGGGCGCN